MSSGRRSTSTSPWAPSAGRCSAIGPSTVSATIAPGPSPSSSSASPTNSGASQRIGRPFVDLRRRRLLHHPRRSRMTATLVTEHERLVLVVGHEDSRSPRDLSGAGHRRRSEPPRASSCRDSKTVRRAATPTARGAKARAMRHPLLLAPRQRAGLAVGQVADCRPSRARVRVRGCHDATVDWCARTLRRPKLLSEARRRRWPRP